MSTDWQAEFRYLTTLHTRPSPDDLYNSLRNEFTKPEAAALAYLICALADRIVRLESALEASQRVAGIIR